MSVRRTEPTFSSVVDAAADGVLVLDTSGNVVYANESGAALFGRTRGDLRGRSLGIPVDGPSVQEIDIRRPNGAGTAEMYAQPTRWNGQPAYLIVLRDTTQRAQTGAALRVQKASLERSNDMLERYAFLASHDLRRPLRIVSGFTQLLRTHLAGTLDATAQRYLTHIVEQAAAMDRMVNGVLALAKVDRAALSSETISLNDLVAEAVHDMHSTVTRVGATVAVADLPEVQADHGLIRQLFDNLLENAVKYRSAEPLHIEVSARLLDDAWEVSIADNGIGIPAPQRDYVFIMFHRVSPSEARTGTGIGLALCRSIVERHGGKICVEAARGRGSVFRFTLPAGSC